MGTEYPCSECNESMKPSTETHEVKHKDTTLRLLHFPVDTCVNGHVMYGWSNIKDFLKEARSLYDTKGITDFDCLKKQTK